MTAAGSFVANGGLSSVFGSSPLSSLSSAVSGIASAGGSTMGSLASTVSGTLATTGQSWFGELTNTLSSMASSVVEFTGPMREAWNTMAISPVAAGNNVFMQTVGTFGPGPAQFLQSVTQNAFQSAINMGLSWAGETLGGTGQLVAGVLSGDPSKLNSIFSSAQSYVNIANNFVNAAERSGEYLNKTFTNLDQTITAGVTGVSNWVEGLGDDIAKLGDTVSWEKLSNLGSPGQLLANMEQNGTLGPLYSKLGNITISDKDAQQLGYNVASSVFGVASGGKGNIGLTDITRGTTLGSLGVDLNTIARQGANLPSGVQKQVYDILGTLTSNETNQVKGILNNTQAAVTRGQDLLNPQKLFGKSFTTLTTPIRTASPGWRAIYENESGSVNPELNDLGGELKGIIPDDVAVANAALSRSLLQVKGIQKSSTTLLATSISQLENLRGLPDLQDQTQYVTDAVRDYWLDYYGSDYGINLSTGNYNTLVLSDVIGYAAGYNSDKPINDNAVLAQELNSAGAFNEFTQSQGIYETIQAFCAGSFTFEDPMMPGDWYTVIPVGWSAAGTYGPFATEEEAFEDAWINGIIPFTVLANVDIVSNYPQGQQAYDNDLIWQNQYGREYLNRQRMDLDIATLPGGNQQAINLAQNLPNIGTDTSFGGPAMWMERVANVDSLGGQSVIAAMREGRNRKRLDDAGLITDGPISTAGLEYPGELTPNQYNKQEADDLVIRT